jgi:hypothetical protein
MSQPCLCATCFHHYIEDHRSGKYGELYTVLWRCGMEIRKPVVYKKVTERGRVLEEHPCSVLSCDKYFLSPWRKKQ